MLFEIKLKHTRNSGFEDYHTYEIESKDDWLEDEQDGLPFNFAIEEAIMRFYEEGNSIWQGDSLKVVEVKLLKQSNVATRTESALDFHEKNLKGIEEVLVRATYEIYGKGMPESFKFHYASLPNTLYHARLMNEQQYQISWDNRLDLFFVAGSRIESKENVAHNILTKKWIIVKDNPKIEVTPEVQEELRKQKNMVLDFRTVKNVASARIWFELGFDEALKTLGLNGEDQK